MKYKSEHKTTTFGIKRWPYSTDDVAPLARWRTLPPDAFSAGGQLEVVAALNNVAVLHGPNNLAAALRGDSAAAISVALSLMPVQEVTFPVDIAMSTLLVCALNDDAAAALVLSHVLGRAAFDHAQTIELSTAWLAHHLRSSRDPHQFARTEEALSLIVHDEEDEA